MARPKRYDSEAEKQAAYRLRKKGGDTVLDSLEKESVVQTKLGDSDVVTSEQKPVIEYTVTDHKFEESNPGYFIYMKEVKKRECAECGKGFTTRLELNRFCGPGCKKKFLDTHFSTSGVKHEGD